MSTATRLGESFEQTVGDVTVRYRACGAGAPIVFVHGLLVNGDLWRDVVPALAGRFRCIVPDWPLGSHQLPLPATADLRPPAVAQLVIRFIAALGLHDVTLVASDTGGAIAQLVVSDDPARIGALVLSNCDAFENFFPPAFAALTYLARVPGFIDALAYACRSERVQRLICATVAHRRPERDILQSYFAPLISDVGVRNDLRKFVAAVDKRYTLAAAERFGAFRKPVGIGWGEDDALLFPLRYARRLCAAFPLARLRTFPGARTFVSEDRPRELAEFIAEIAHEGERLAQRDIMLPVD